MISDWDEMIDTNVKGLLYVTHGAAGDGRAGQRPCDQHRLIAGHEPYPGGNVYCASKAAVAMLNKTLRLDLLGTGIRVTGMEAGLVETEFSLVRFHGDEQRAVKPYQGLQPLAAADIADAILWAATRPTHVNVENIVLFPTAQADRDDGAPNVMSAKCFVDVMHDA